MCLCRERCSQMQRFAFFASEVSQKLKLHRYITLDSCRAMPICYQCEERTRRSWCVTEGGRLYCTGCWYDNRTAKRIYEFTQKMLAELNITDEEKAIILGRADS